MPASTLDPVNAALRTTLTKNKSENTLESQLAVSTKKALLTNIKFEPAGSYQNSVLDKLKSKYTTLKSVENQQQSNSGKSEKMGADETLSLAKYVLYPIESVQLGWNNADWSVGAGMVNMGNTCYLNSTLQALFHVPALVNWLISDKQHMAECEDSGGLCIICAMRKTLQDSQQRNTNTIRPFLIYNKLRIVCRNLIPGRQEDAHEFLRYLVEAMEKSYLNRFKNHSEFDSKTKETTPLNQILGGYLRSAVRCLECGHVSTTFQHFQDLLLDIRKAQTLDEALDTYFSKEKLDDESYHCEACHKKVPATKQFFLERAPMVLCIQLKRFSISNNKITKHIQFRQKLELTKYAKHRPPIPLVYRLVALVTHMGPTVGCGHYTAVAQAPTGNFYQFDDSMVRPISHQAVFSTNAYIMLYELETSPFTQKSTPVAKKLKNQSTDTSSLIQNDESKANIVKTNGTSSSKVYGPELPPGKLEQPCLVQNGNVQNILNGNSHIDSPSSSESETELIENEKVKEEKSLGSSIICSTSNCNSTKGLKSPKSENTAQKLNTDSLIRPLSTNNGSSKQEKSMRELNIGEQKNPKKLVPYDMDDSSSCSEEFSSHETEPRVPTKALVGEWKVTSTSSSTSHSEVKSVDKKPQSDRSTVNELLKMSHGGYSVPVTSWNGTRAQLDKEINSERREDRKRCLTENIHEGRTKHQKTNSNNSYKSNPGYNPIQEIHNIKNWNQNGGSYHSRQFFNGNRYRRNNFHHRTYHKNYRFRQ